MLTQPDVEVACRRLFDAVARDDDKAAMAFTCSLLATSVQALVSIAASLETLASAARKDAPYKPGDDVFTS